MLNNRVPKMDPLWNSKQYLAPRGIFVTYIYFLLTV